MPLTRDRPDASDDRSPCPYHAVVARIRAEAWTRRRDSTLDQLRDLAAVADALGCRDAADLMRRMAGEGARRGVPDERLAVPPGAPDVAERWEC